MPTAIRRALEPPRASDAPPPWLLSQQQETFARTVWAARHHGLALVADPVGSGKTFVALAAASVLNPERPTACIVPAVLLSQWAAVAARLRLPVVLHSHEKTSRGGVPPDGGPLAIIDESHRFRMPVTKRYRVLAPWLVGKRVLLLSGTPVVNRAADLLHQLRLGVGDDVLAEFGIPALGALLDAERGHPALTRVVIISQTPAVSGGDARSARPLLRATELRSEAPGAAGLAGRIDALRLSTARDVAALVRVGLLRAFASSPAAFVDVLRRYRSLLRHAADASAAGRPVTRRDLRAAVGIDEAQLVLWSLLESPEAAGEVELDPGDLPSLDALLATVGNAGCDLKADQLRSILSDGRRSIVFVTHRATVTHLRYRLEDLRVAWCTGSAAGVGRVKMPRSAVLAAFDPAFAAAPRAAPCSPLAAGADTRPDIPHAMRVVPEADVLIATDVAAEGLDLQRAERVVHYDLPWTPMRLRQREGRALRLGSSHAVVEVVRFRPPPAIEQRLRMGRVLRRKEQLPDRLGIGNPARGAAGTLPSHDGATAPSGADGTRRPDSSELLILAAERSSGPGASIVLLRRSDQTLITDPQTIRRTLSRLAVTLTATPPVLDAPQANAIASAAVRRLVRTGSDGAPPPPPRTVPADLLARLTLIADEAARARDDALLERVDAAIRFLRRPRTAGEDALADALARCSLAQLRRRIQHLPAERLAPSWEVIVAVPL